MGKGEAGRAIRMEIWGHRCGFMGQESGKESRGVDKGVGM
jgi:hypothetical protein